MLTKSDIKLIKSLGDKEGRREAGLFVAEGEKMVGEALSSRMTVERVFVSSAFGGRLPQMRAEVTTVSPSEMERISKLKTAPQVIALVRVPPAGAEVANPITDLTLALDDIQDPGNVGTILRLADWFGIGRIVCSPATADIYNPKVVQASMGSVFRVAVEYRPLPEFLSAAGVPVYGAFLEGDDIYKADLLVPGIVVLGNEGKGISPSVAKLVSRKIYIPPYPAGRQGAESLNVATAAAVICSEFRRR